MTTPAQPESLDPAPAQTKTPMTDAEPNHGEAMLLAQMKADTSNLARSYLALRAAHEEASAHASRVGLLRESMTAVAQILDERADSWEMMAKGLRYDEPRGIRHAMDVHVNLLRDLAEELRRPGETKYSPLPRAHGEQAEGKERT